MELLCFVAFGFRNEFLSGFVGDGIASIFVSGKLNSLDELGPDCSITSIDIFTLTISVLCIELVRVLRAAQSFAVEDPNRFSSSRGSVCGHCLSAS